MYTRKRFLIRRRNRARRRSVPSPRARIPHMAAQGGHKTAWRRTSRVVFARLSATMSVEIAFAHGRDVRIAAVHFNCLPKCVILYF